ncbi:hypothetical protein SeMB42_g04617 [Synchytrium endobioticum]|uniref:HIT-type domain-containing protein n=1 Tax=Synchytrium endobioticum TaxID=286115 RepID=A0A507CWZ0_9FUNG|nr:hypothetical protein SeMB42_g04617 [Synchytrium endobioticum]TPX47903.1 hypothetical protein SeLEV6574_g02363 [Synchytrium endobioticum]
MPPKASKKNTASSSPSSAASVKHKNSLGKPLDRIKAIERTATRTPTSTSSPPTQLDDATRSRALQRRLDDLERDNSGAAPDSDIPFSTLATTGAGSGPRRARGLADDANQYGLEDNVPAGGARANKKIRRLLLLKKNLGAYIAESKFELLPPNTPNYLTAGAPASKFPPRKICSVCGFDGCYTCVKCGMRVCSIRCKAAHDETRCLKFTS